MASPLTNAKQQAMARELARMSSWPSVIPNLTPELLDQTWGAGPNEKYDLYRGPGTGLRRVVCYFSFGGGTVGDHRQPAVSAFGGGNSLAWYFTRSPVAEAIGPTDFVSVNYEKFRWDVPTPVTHIAPYVATNNPTTCPTQRTRLAAFFGAPLTSLAVTHGWDLSRVHAMGSSHGGVLLSLELLENGLPIKTLTIESPLPDYRNQIVYWTTAEGMYGDGSELAWATRSPADKAAITQLVRLGSIPRTYKPMQVINSFRGDETIPYGDPLRIGSSIHDVAQWRTIKRELERIRAPARFELIHPLGWSDPAFGAHQVSMHVADFMLAKE